MGTNYCGAGVNTNVINTYPVRQGYITVKGRLRNKQNSTETKRRRWFGSFTIEAVHIVSSMHDPARLSTAKDAVLLRSHDIIKSSTEVSRMSALDQRGPTPRLRLGDDNFWKETARSNDAAADGLDRSLSRQST